MAYVIIGTIEWLDSNYTYVQPIRALPTQRYIVFKQNLVWL